MNRLITIGILMIILLPGCEKYDIPKDYPTTYYILSSGALSKQRSEYSSRNPYISSSLNEFGFCGYSGAPLSVTTPPSAGAKTREEIIDIVKHFVSENRNETGVDHPDAITFSVASTDTGYNGSVGWYFRTANQRADTIEVLNTSILFHVTNASMTLCCGNWYPEIFIPRKFNISQDVAKNNLIGKVVSHYSFDGTLSQVTIAAADVENSSVNLKIIPAEDDGKIELHLCWQVNIPAPVYYEIYIDVMTGSIIVEEPTIIS